MVLNKLNRLVLLVLFSLWFLTGCSTTGNTSLKYDSPELIANQLRIGTTKAEVLRLLGPPNDISFIGDGLEVLKYEFQRHKPWVRNFTPLALFSTGSDIGVRQIVVLLDQNGTIKNITTNAVVLKRSFGISE